MSQETVVTCARCKEEIKRGGAVITMTVEDAFVKTYLSSKDGKIELCELCATAFVDWMKNSKSSKLGPVERIARREGGDNS